MVKNLVGWADVVIVGNRPARAAELGIDYQSVLSINDNVVYCQITGYGLGGPWSQLGAHGLNIDAMAGSIQVEGRGERVDPVVGFRTVGTNTAGMSAASGIFAALYRRERGLGSQFVHVSVWEAAVSWMWRDALSLSLVGTGMPEHRDAGPRNGVYETADGRHVVVCPIERHFWERFCDALGLPAEMRDRGDWSSGTCDGRGPRAPEERAVIRERILEMTSDEVVTLLSRVDVPASPLLTVGEACASDQAASSGTMMPMSYRGERLSVPSVPVSVISRSDLPSLDLESLAAAHRERAVGLRSPAEWIGQHGDEVRDDLKIERP
ncbi:hypothetical protein ASE24_19435 [Nocardioides sp. Root224]|nr:hypothetical protein ASE24_19435 [Nocardioides sp. Root224]